MSEVDFKQLAKEIAGKQKSSSSILLLLIITLLSVIFIWAAVTELDNVVRGDGKTVSEVQNQLVQSSQSGVILKRHIDTGDIVVEGQLLFDIDPVEVKTQLDQAEKRYTALLIRSTRLKAEVDNSLPMFSDELIEAAPNTVTTELALYRARSDDLKTKSAILEKRRLQKLNEIQEQKILFKTSEKSLELIRREIDTVEPLVKSGLAPETRLIALRRDEEVTIGNARSAESVQIRLMSGLEEIEEQLNAENQNYLTNALTDLSLIEQEISELEARIPALEEQVARTSVESPVNGVINQINYSTVGAYVRSGDVLLEIVPTGSDLIVKAKIDPKDIADVVIGQDVKISLTAYNPAKFGRIDGNVVKVSADALTDDKSRNQYYEVDVSINGTLYEKDGAEVIILPGMVASIDVLSGKRTILDYFWQPIASTKDRALRD